MANVYICGRLWTRWPTFANFAPCLNNPISDYQVKHSVLGMGLGGDDYTGTEILPEGGIRSQEENT